MATKGGGGGGGGGSGAIRAGRAFIELFATDNKLVRTLEGVKGRLTKFGSFFGKVGLGLGAAGTALFAPLTALLKSGMDRADQIGDLGEVFGLTADSASRFASAMEMAGGTIEDLEMAFGKLAASNKSGKPLDEHFLDVADSINSISDASERFKAAKEIFGDKFARKFIDNSGDISEFVKNAPSLSAEEIKNSKAMNIEMARTWIVLKSSLLSVLEVVTPLAKVFFEFIRTNSKLLGIVFAVGAGLMALSAITTAVGFAFTGLATILGGVMSVVGFILSPLGLILVTLGAITAAVALSIRSFDDWSSSLQSLFGGVAGAAKTSWAGISDALKMGDLELAGKIAFAGLSLAWHETARFFKAVWIDFKKFFVDGWHDAIMLLTLAWNDFDAAFKKITERIADFLVKTIIAAVKTVVTAAAIVGDVLGLNDISGPMKQAMSWLDRAEAARKEIHDDEVRRIDIRQRLMEKAIHKVAADEQAERDKARAADLAADDADIAAAKAKLDLLRQQAAAAVNLAAVRKLGASILAGAFGGGPGTSPLDALANVRGGFASRSTSLEFAFGKKSEESLKTVAKNTDTLPSIMGVLESIFDELRNRNVVN